MPSAEEEQEYLAKHNVEAAITAAVRRAIRERPADPIAAIGEWLSADVTDESAKPGADAAAATIAGYLKCMNAKIKTSGKGVQNAEMLLVHKTNGELVIEDHGGWALRNASMARLLRELDASGALPDFAPVLVQTGDRCIARKHTDGRDGAELHLWQSQPVPEELRARTVFAKSGDA